MRLLRFRKKREAAELKKRELAEEQRKKRELAEEKK